MMSILSYYPVIGAVGSIEAGGVPVDPWRMVMSLGFTLSVFFIGVGIVQRRRGKGRVPRSIILRDRVSVTNKATLCLIEVKGYSYLCAVAGESVTLQALPEQSALDMKSTENEDALTDEFNQVLKVVGHA